MRVHSKRLIIILVLSLVFSICVVSADVKEASETKLITWLYLDDGLMKICPQTIETVVRASYEMSSHGYKATDSYLRGMACYANTQPPSFPFEMEVQLCNIKWYLNGGLIHTFTSFTNNPSSIIPTEWLMHDWEVGYVDHSDIICLQPGNYLKQEGNIQVFSSDTLPNLHTHSVSWTW